MTHLFCLLALFLSFGFGCFRAEAFSSREPSPATSANAGDPGIVQQPVGLIVNAGSTAVLFVGAVGTPPLYFKWFKDETPLLDNGHISGAKSAQITISSLTRADIGHYSVMVSNGFGEVISSNALLVVDSTPTIACPNISVGALVGQCEAIVNFTNVSVQDDFDSEVTVICDPPSGTTLPVGVTRVWCTAKDFSGNVASNSFTVSVYPVVGEGEGDTNWAMLPPVIIDATNRAILVNGADGIQVDYSVTATNVCQPNVPVTCTPPSGSIFPNGTTIVKCIATDAFNISVTNTFEVSVQQPPTISIHPLGKYRQLQGTNVVFKVVATGTALEYQWKVEGDSIPGATNSIYSFDAQPINGKTNLAYSVVVSNLVGSVTSYNAMLTIIPDRKKPVLGFANPAPRARVSTVILGGTVTDNTQIKAVRYWCTNFNNGVVTVSTATDTILAGLSPTLKSWSSVARPFPGTNIVTVEAVDMAGNYTRSNRAFFFIVPASLTVSRTGTGLGTVRGMASVPGDTVPALGTRLLNIGEAYSITAIPGSNSMFAYWTGTLGVSTNPVLKFVMESNTTVQAVFLTNRFSKWAGTFNGLFYETNGLTMETAGALKNLNVTRAGACSGRMFLNGTNHLLSGMFNNEGVFRTALTNAGRQVTISMYLDWDSVPASYRVLGNVEVLNEDETWSSAPIVADRAGHSQVSGAYIITLRPQPGSGFGQTDMQLWVSAGAATLSGTLADETSIAYTAPVSKFGWVPVYVDLYRHAGLLEGWISLAGGTPSGKLAWIKKATNGAYSRGFTNSLSVVRWSK